MSNIGRATLEHEWFKNVYNKNKELKKKILDLKELNEELFDEVFKYINKTNIFIESNVITSDVLLECDYQVRKISYINE